MRILIIGAGNAGRYLATKLSAERHDIVVIDRDDAALREIQSRVDVGTLLGDGCDPAVLREAGVAKTDLMVAVTDRDEVNILACALANLAGVRHKVARVSRAEVYRDSEEYDLRRLGIDLAVSQKEECAEEIYNILRMPGTLEAVDMLDGRAIVVGVKVHMDSPMIFQTLKSFPRPDLVNRIRFIAVLRSEELLLPDGNTQFMIGDDVFLVATPGDVKAFLQWAHPEHAEFEKIVIAGGGSLGLQLARMLEAGDMNVVLIERDERRAEECAGRLDDTLVMHGDALDRDIFQSVEIVKGTAVVAATGDDETNIMICLLGEKAGAVFTLAQVAKPDYVPIIGSLSLLDRAVSSHMSMINSILHFVRGKNVTAVATLQKLPGELLEVSIPPGHPWAGRAIRDIRLPAGMIVATICRAGAVEPAVGDFVFAAGDQVVVYAVPKAVGKVASILKG